MVKILIVDRHAMTRDCLHSVIETTGEFEVVGEASDGPSAIDTLKRLSVDTAIVDLATLGRHAPEIIGQLDACTPALRILALSLHAAPHRAAQAFDAGATGYVAKDCSSADLMQAIRRVSAGHRYVDVRVAERLAQPSDLPPNAPLHRRLSERELDVLKRLASGESGTEIADALKISLKTVSSYKTHLLDKLELRSEAALIRYALLHGIVEPD
ncbi:LuxR C-terminal-related transcriptional regulator [Burkholderia ubonensis]|uniref:LuxR C-terminal-related transcriptional regulator n=1 Tax=Burkholderia ubonensis TaxID=101571 RepID=UPI00358E289A